MVPSMPSAAWMAQWVSPRHSRMQFTASQADSSGWSSRRRPSREAQSGRPVSTSSPAAAQRSGPSSARPSQRSGAIRCRPGSTAASRASAAASKVVCRRHRSRQNETKSGWIDPNTAVTTSSPAAAIDAARVAR